MNKENEVYIHNRLLVSMTKKETPPFAATCINLEGIMLNKMSNIEKQKLYDLTYMWNLKVKLLETE